MLRNVVPFFSVADTTFPIPSHSIVTYRQHSAPHRLNFTDSTSPHMDPTSPTTDTTSPTPSHHSILHFQSTSFLHRLNFAPPLPPYCLFPIQSISGLKGQITDSTSHITNLCPQNKIQQFLSIFDNNGSWSAQKALNQIHI